MKKILTLLITIILLTGCTAKYNINIQENNIEDVLTIKTNLNKVNNSTDKETEQFANNILNWETNYEHYKKERFNTKDNIGYKYSYNFNYNEYNVLSYLSKCYENVSITNDEYIILNANGEFSCSNYINEIKELSINITSEYIIDSSNADNIKDNTHTWIIDTKNYQNKPIYIKIDKNILANKNNTLDKITPQMILVTLLFIIIITYLLINKRKYKNKK